MEQAVRSNILKLINQIKLPVPRLESRNFVDIENIKVPNSLGVLVDTPFYRIQTYYILVYEELSDNSLGFTLIDSSVASAIPLTHLEPEFWLGFRRSGDVLNLSFQLKIPAFVTDSNNNFSEIIMNDKNTPHGLTVKKYYKK